MENLISKLNFYKLIPSGQMHLSGTLPVSPNVRKKRVELGSGRDQ